MTQTEIGRVDNFSRCSVDQVTASNEEKARGLLYIARTIAQKCGLKITGGTRWRGIDHRQIAPIQGVAIAKGFAIEAKDLSTSTQGISIPLHGMRQRCAFKADREEDQSQDSRLS